MIRNLEILTNNLLLEMKSSLNRSLTDQQQHEVDKVTPYVIKEAAKKLSENKSDPVYSFSSDCLINGTDQLFKQLSTVFKVFLIHGHFTLFLLLATLVPIIKDKSGSVSTSKNYRSIAISSLTLNSLIGYCLSCMATNFALTNYNLLINLVALRLCARGVLWRQSHTFLETDLMYSFVVWT